MVSSYLAFITGLWDYNTQSHIANYRLLIPKGDYDQQSCNSALGWAGSGQGLQVEELHLTYCTGLKIKMCSEAGFSLLAWSL
jgi:hypothetical protein